MRSAGLTDFLVFSLLIAAMVLIMTADNYSSQQSCRGVAGEQLGIAAVHPQHLQRFVAGLVADLHQVDAALDRRRDQARPQAVPAKGRRVEAKLGGSSLDHAGDIARS
jgi:hypothetical protein